MINKSALLILPLLAMAVSSVRAVNPPIYPICPGVGGCNPKDGDEKGNHPSWNWSINIGLVKYNPSGNFLDYGRVGAVEGSLSGALPRSLDAIMSFYNGGGVANRQQTTLDLSASMITAALADPASLTYHHEPNAEVIKLNGFVNQTLTDTALTHINKLSGDDGFRVRIWSRPSITLGSKSGGLYPVPAETPINDVTFKNPDHPSDNHKLLKTSVENFGSLSRTTTRSYEETLNGTTNLPETFTIKTYSGANTSGTLLEIEKLTYSNRGSKLWDYHIEREIWTAHTAADDAYTLFHEDEQSLRADLRKRHLDYTDHV